jgi:hypothetical protein
MPIGCSRNRSISEPWKARVVGAFEGGRFHGVGERDQQCHAHIPGGRGSAPGYQDSEEHCPAQITLELGVRAPPTQRRTKKAALA